MALGKHQAAGRLSLAAAHPSTLSSAIFTRSDWTPSCPSNCRCRAAASSPFRRTIRRWRSTASSANSAPGNITAAAWRTTSGSTISRPATTENLTNNPAQDICPMWGPDNRIYFLSDRDGRMNLFSIDLGTKETKQLTTFKDFDIKFPSHRRRTRSSSSRPATSGVTIWRAGRPRRCRLRSRRISPPAARPSSMRRNTSSRSTWRRMASARSSSRGAIFFPCRRRMARRANLTKTSNAHERDAVWSPDGKWIAYNSDETGENELYVRVAGRQRRSRNS